MENIIKIYSNLTTAIILFTISLFNMRFLGFLQFNSKMLQFIDHQINRNVPAKNNK